MFEFWKGVIRTNLKNKEFDLSVAVLCSVMYKAKISAEKAAMLSDNDAWDLFLKTGHTKKLEFLRHNHYLMDANLESFTLYNMLGPDSDAKDGILEFIPDAIQSFPAYTDIPTHVEKCASFFNTMRSVYLPFYFDTSVRKIKDATYVTGDSLLQTFFDVDFLSENKKDINLTLGPIIENDRYILRLLSKELDNSRVSFILQAGRSTLSTLSVLPGCVISNVSANTNSGLDRRQINISHELPEYVVTLFDLKNMLSVLRKNVIIDSTIQDLVNNLIDLDNSL